MIHNQDFSVVAVIPAHLASVRFPRKILHPFYGLPMIEHVRRRALMCSSLKRVVVATCDDEICSVVRGYGGDVIMTSNLHRNGTTRVAEAVDDLHCSHVMVLQGDEPLLLPSHINLVLEAMHCQPQNLAWNATGPIDNAEELDRHSFVKCAVSPSGRVMYCFRRNPCFTFNNNTHNFIRKILGVIAYRKDFLATITNVNATPIELSEYIEQMRIIENDYTLISVPVEPTLPSVNEPSDVQIVFDYLSSADEQRQILKKLLAL